MCRCIVHPSSFNLADHIDSNYGARALAHAYCPAADRLAYYNGKFHEPLKPARMPPGGGGLCRSLRPSKLALDLFRCLFGQTDVVNCHLHADTTYRSTLHINIAHGVSGTRLQHKQMRQG